MGNVQQSFPKIYATIDNLQVDHHASIIDMEGKMCNPIISILICLDSNYIYICSELVEKRNLAK